MQSGGCAGHEGGGTSAAMSTSPSPEPIRVLDRASGKLVDEDVFGGDALRWAYGTRAGWLFTRLIGSRRAFSAAYGLWMRSPFSRGGIRPFIERFRIPTVEIDGDVAAFRSFDAFFTRRLKPGARPLAGGPETLVLPADGRHLVHPDGAAQDGFVLKGQRLDLPALLGDAALARTFAGGAVLVSRLCPVDYHRFHFPCDGVAGVPRWVNGPLFSVSPIALRRNVAFLWENRRCVTLLETPRFGPVAYVEIGATMVGCIRHTRPPGAFARGDEKGCFHFGGSSLALVFRPGAVVFDADLVAASARHVETLAPQGGSLGRSAT